MIMTFLFEEVKLLAVKYIRFIFQYVPREKNREIRLKLVFISCEYFRMKIVVFLNRTS